jgi:hypothetical protein
MRPFQGLMLETQQAGSATHRLAACTTRGWHASRLHGLDAAIAEAKTIDQYTTGFPVSLQLFLSAHEPLSTRKCPRILAKGLVLHRRSSRNWCRLHLADFMFGLVVRSR